MNKLFKSDEELKLQYADAFIDNPNFNVSTIRYFTVKMTLI